MKKKISAEIVQDSISPTGNRLTTFILVFPRIVLSELNTHRAFSKNSASSRAIPFEKMLKMVEEDPFIPVRFQKDHSGMQGKEYYQGEEHEICVSDWLKARDSAVNAAKSFRLTVTKQLRNRLLEPFLWHTVILSGTEFGNFFALRAHSDAEIHIEALAYAMLDEYNASTPKSLKEGEWHIPFGDNIDESRLRDTFKQEFLGQDITMESQVQANKRKVAIARCARISFLNYEGKDDYAADIKLCDRLFGSNPKHLSPTEHVAMAMNDKSFYGNFCGFKQFRKLFVEENLQDSRVVKKQYILN